MYLFWGVSCLSLVFILGAAALLVSRNPEPPRWAGDFFIQAIAVPGLIGLLILGVSLVIKYAAALPGWGSGITAIGLSGGVAAMTVVLLRLMKVGDRLDRYAEQAQQARRVSLPGGKAMQPPQPPTPPSAGIDQKAA